MMVSSESLFRNLVCSGRIRFTTRLGRPYVSRADSGSLAVVISFTQQIFTRSRSIVINGLYSK
uniref:Uncharacterized protein n=1 Tax=Anguilla anguilla TaxID=7936 RepID=A0A0E9RP07_ANGAN